MYSAIITQKKHEKMKGSMDFSKIVVDGKLLGVLKFNLMIPMEEKQLQFIDTTIHKRDRENKMFKLSKIGTGVFTI